MTPDEFVQFCSDLTDAVEDKDSYIITPLWGVLSIFQNRVFKDGKNTKGEKINPYWKYYSVKYDGFWPEVRMRYGKQIDYVDLNFTGDLKNSFQLSRDVDRENYSIIINDEEEREKADFQEHLQGWKRGNPQKKKLAKGYKKTNFSEIYATQPMEIFALSDKEYKDFNELLDKAFELRTLMAISKYR